MIYTFNSETVSTKHQGYPPPPKKRKGNGVGWSWEGWGGVGGLSLWLSAALFDMMIPAGIIMPKSAADNQGDNSHAGIMEKRAADSQRVKTSMGKFRDEWGMEQPVQSFSGDRLQQKPKCTKSNCITGR